MAECVCLNVFVSVLTKLMVVLSKGRLFSLSPSDPCWAEECRCCFCFEKRE